MLIWLHLFIGTGLSLRKTHAMEVRHTRADYSHPVMRSRISVASIQRQVFEYWDALLIGICLSVSLGRLGLLFKLLGSKEWRDAIVRCAREWHQLFPAYDPLTGDYFADYLTDGVFDRDP